MVPQNITNRTYHPIKIECDIPENFKKIKSGNPPFKRSREDNQIYSGNLTIKLIPVNPSVSSSNYNIQIASIENGIYSSNIDFNKNNIAVKINGKITKKQNYFMLLEFVLEDSKFICSTLVTVKALKNRELSPIIFRTGSFNELNEKNSKEIPKNHSNDEQITYKCPRNTNDNQEQQQQQQQKAKTDNITPEINPSITLKYMNRLVQFEVKNEKDCFKIGRDKSCDVIIENEILSSFAATIRFNKFFQIEITNKHGATLYKDVGQEPLYLGKNTTINLMQGYIITFPTPPPISEQKIKIEHICHHIQ